MLKSYVLNGLRAVKRQPFYAGINVAGLALGLACTFVIVLFVEYETSFDQFHTNGENIYRVIPRAERDGIQQMQTWTPTGFAPRLKARFAEIEEASRFAFIASNPVIRHENRLFPALDVVAADSTFLTIFDIPMHAGDPRTVLQDKSSIVIARSVAENMFPGESPLGKILRFENLEWTVTGVLDDYPSNSHLKFGYLMAFRALERMRFGPDSDPAQRERFFDDLGTWNYTTYLLLRSGVDPARFQGEVTAFLDELMGRQPTPGSDYWLQPLSEVHFTPGIRGNVDTRERGVIRMFSAIAGFILLIACFNFMNLSSARAMRRSREVGVRKVLGAQRRQLLLQFLAEALLLTFAALVLSLVLLKALIPLMDRLLNVDIAFSFSDNLPMLSVLVAIALFTGIVSGSYPAWLMSAFQPVYALKNELAGSHKSRFRQAVITFQFGIAILLFLGTSVLFLQYRHMSEAALGFNQEQVVSFRSNQELSPKFAAFAEALKSSPHVKAVTRGNGAPGRIVSFYTYDFQTPEGAVRRSMNTFNIDFETIDVYQFELLDGRNLDPSFATDLTHAYLINEAAAKALGLDQPVGAAMQVRARENGMGTVVGVVKDFHYKGLQSVVEPLAMWVSPPNSYYVGVRIQGDLEQAIAHIEQVWGQFSPSYPFSYVFLDEDFDRLYAAEKTTSTMLASFSILAIVVACLGLLGLSAFMAELRTREIGIRKVLGARVDQIVRLLCRDFARPILVAFVLVAPLGWYLANRWLESYAYRIELGWEVVLLSGLMALIFGLLTVASQSLRSASLDPVQVLKRE